MARKDAAKHFWMKFDFGEWLTAPELMLASESVRGFWMDLICHMEKARSAELTATSEQFARLGRCPESKTGAYLQELSDLDIADVEVKGGVFRVVCRRIARQLQVSEARRNAVTKRADRSGDFVPTKGGTKRVQTPLQTSSFNSYSVPEEGVQGGIAAAQVGVVYAAYPRKVGKSGAFKAIRAAVRRLGSGQDLPRMEPPDALAYLRARADTYARSPAGQAGAYTPHPATWFNDERYLDNDNEWSKGHGKPQESGNAQRVSPAAQRQAESDDGFRNIAARRYGVVPPAANEANAGPVPEPDLAGGIGGDVPGGVGGDHGAVRNRDVPGRIIEGNPR